MNLYLLFVAICFAILVFHNWYSGEDLNSGGVVLMLVESFIPLINLLLLTYVLFDLFSLVSKKGVLSLEGEK